MAPVRSRLRPRTLLAGVALLLLSSTVMRAAGQPPEDAACLECHSGDDLRQVPGKAPIAHADAIHLALGCQTCHEGFTGFSGWG